MSESMRDALLHLAMRRHDHSNGCDRCRNVQTQVRAALASPAAHRNDNNGLIGKPMEAKETSPAAHPFIPGAAPTDEFDTDYRERCHQPDGRRGLICGRPASEHAPAAPRPEGPVDDEPCARCGVWRRFHRDGPEYSRDHSWVAAEPRPEGLEEWQRQVIRDAAEFGVVGARLWLARENIPAARLSDTGDTEEPTDV